MPTEPRSTPTMQPARRGDLMLLATTMTTSYTKGPNVTQERIEIGTVTSVTRDGQVKAWASPSHEDDLQPPSHLLRAKIGDRVLLVSSEEIDVDAALASYRAHTWENSGSRLIRPLESLDEARSLLRPFLIGDADGSKG